MENLSSLFLILVFGLGTVVGGLVVTLQRQCEMERIRQEFEQELVASVRRQSGYAGPTGVGLGAIGAKAAQAGMVVDSAESEQQEANGEEVDSWDGAFIPAAGNARHTHAGV
jgi:homoserine dehydrogenase